jgi:hypothetical protein
MAVLFITASVLMGTSAAFADAAPVFDQQVQTGPGFFMVTVRDAPSSQGNDVGVLQPGTEYPAGASVQGPPNVYGGTWIQIKLDKSTTGWVNAGMVAETAALVAKVAPTATPAKVAAATPAPPPAATATAAGQVTISTITIWLALTGILTLAAAAVSYFIRRPVVQLSAAGLAAAAAITVAFFRVAGSGLPTAAPTLVVVLVAAAAEFIAVSRRFDGERPSMQLLRPALRDWKVTAPTAVAALVPAIILAVLGQSQLVSAVVVMIAAAGVAAWRLAIFTNTDRPQPTQIEPGEYRPRGFTPPTGGNLS